MPPGVAIRPGQWVALSLCPGHRHRGRAIERSNGSQLARYTSNGVRYQVDNVVITQPAIPDSDTLSSTSYRVMETRSSSVGLPPNTTGGLTQLSQLPRILTIIHSGN